MSLISRLLLALMTCLLLSNCGLIGTALRLAPYYLLLADNSKDATVRQASSTLEERGRQVAGSGRHVAKTTVSAFSAAQVVSR